MECVRGLAALWVFLFHIADQVRASCPPLYGLARHGHYGVPIFFVVSGYCIFAAAQRCIQNDSSSIDFLQRRLWRIFPTFWVSIVIVLGLPYLIEGVASFKSGTMVWPTPAWTQYTLVDWLAITTLTKELVDSVRGGGPGYTLLNSVYWTLAIEVQFYLVMYLAILFRRRWLAILGGVSIAGFGAIAMHVFAWPGFFVQFWPAFLCGVVLRIIYSRDHTPEALFGRYAFVGALASVAVFIALFGWLVQSEPAPAFTEIAAVAALVLWGLGGVESSLSSSVISFPQLRRYGAVFLMPLLLLGQCSYSLYLLHGKLYQFTAMFVRQLIPMTSPLYLAVLVVATVILVYGFYYVVERRCQQRASRTAKPVPVAYKAGTPEAYVQIHELSIPVQRDTLP